MDIDKNILTEDVLAFPLEYTEGNCEAAIDERLEKYIATLRNYAGTMPAINATQLFREKLSEMYKEYYLGHQNKAYQAFTSALSLQLQGMEVVTSVLPKESLYRARTNVGNKDFKNNEMFHIKYDLRGKVQTQRFSFPGLPCLYLGSSAYVCWLELNRPQFDQFQVAAIKQNDGNKEYRVIDLGIHPLEYYQVTETSDLRLEQYLQWWPIMAACSIAVKNEDDAFKPEYIFPQFMLQYLLEDEAAKEYIGIRYMSIKAGKISKKQYISDYRTYTSYVIPIRSVTPTEDGFCSKLNDKFSVIRTYSGRELQVISDLIRENGIQWMEFGEEPIRHPLDDASIFGTNDLAYPYGMSIFRRIEKILEEDDLNKLQKPPELIINILE